MRKWFTGFFIAAALIGPIVPAARAADHRDGPAATADPTTDITDVYAWMSGDASKAYLVLDVEGGAMGATAMSKFSNTALYAIHVNALTKFGDPATAATEKLIVCQFTADATQKFSCWGPGGEYVTDVTGNAGGAKSGSGKFKVFAGLRDDPFYFNVRGFRALADFVHMAAGGLMSDASGCPKIDAPTSMAAVGLLKSDGKGGAPTDDFGSKGMNTPPLNGNVLSIVIAIDTDLLISGSSKMLSIWASTNKTK